MKTKLLLSISLFLFVGNCWGQITFQRVISNVNSSLASSVQQNTDGGYIIAGYINVIGFNYNGVYLVKTNSEGDTLWTKTYAGPVSDDGYSVQQTTDGGYIVAGNTTDTTNHQHFYVIKTNTVGDTLWTKAYGGDSNEDVLSIQQTNDSGYIITGYTDSFGASGEDVYLIKINSNGDIKWAKTYGGAIDEVGQCVRQTSDTGYIICGWTTSFGAGNPDVYLIKTDVNGDTLWTKTYGGSGDDYGFAVQQTTDGGYIISGWTNSFNGGNARIYLIKTNADGNILWNKTYGGTAFDYSHDVQETTDSGYIITGEANSFGAGDYDVYLIKTNSSGDTLWTKTYGGAGNDNGLSVKQAKDGGYIIAGYTQSFPPSLTQVNVYVLKTDANGNSGCYQSNTNTIVGSPASQVGSTQTIVGSGGAAIPTNTIIGSGGNDSTLCLTLGINELTINNTITLYPNPATDQVIITGNWKENKILQLTIYNIAGERISTQTINRKQETINCKLLSSGIYFITVSDEKEQWVGRFVKE